MADNFTWTPGKPPPSIYEHTKCKLNVIRQYLDIYFDTLSQDVRIERLNISLVDGFCGGGAYMDTTEIVHGSPLVLIDAVQEAEKRINQGRQKRFEINARYYFIDAAPNHIASLKTTLLKRGFTPWIGNKITIIEGKFEDNITRVINDIKSKQKAGRSIFILDQCGYKEVKPELLQQIFQQLVNAEIILTFAIDALLNYLSDASPNDTFFKSLGITPEFLDRWKERNGTGMTRPLAQRIIMERFQHGAKFMTPFILHSEGDNRDMALMHLSGHQRARDKMLGVHWNSHNSFVHYDRGSMYTLGFDKRRVETSNSLFNFTENDHEQMQAELCDALPRTIQELVKDGKLPVTELLDHFGNLTAARNDDIFKTLSFLVCEKEFLIKASDGSPRRMKTMPNVKDLIEIPPQTTFISTFREQNLQSKKGKP